MTSTGNASSLSDATRFLIDFNVHDVATALGLPIPDAASALIYGVDLPVLAAYQSDIDAELAQRALAYQAHSNLGVLAQLAGKRLLCIGDSITTYRRSYAHLLRHLLTPYDVEVVNRGFSGYTSTHGLELMYTQFLALEPDLVFIKYGVNDCKQFGGQTARTLVSPDEYAENLRQIVRAFNRHTAAVVVVLTPTLVVESVLNANPDIMAMRLTWDNNVLSQFGELALQVAAQTSVHSVDLRRTFGTPPDPALYCPDGLHPNAFGHIRMLEAVLDSIPASLLNKQG